MSINKVMITGNLTRDAELRTTPSGTAILNLGVAVNDRRRNQQTGDWEEYANFIDCTMFGRRAEALHQYLTKGTKVAIEGRLHYSQWQDRNTGANRSKGDVTIDEIEFMSSRNGGGNYQGGGYQGGGYQGGGDYQGGGYSQNTGTAAADANAQQGSQNIQEPPAPAAYNDEDIPF